MPSMPIKLVLSACAAFGLIAFSQTQALAEDDLLKLNSKFREIYAQAKNTAALKSQPTIICYADRVELIDGERKESVNNITDRYTTLKTVDHIALALYCLLHDKQGKLDEGSLKTLAELKELVTRARAALTEHDLPVKTRERQYRLIDNCLIFIDETIKTGNSNHDRVQKLSRDLSADILENAYEAVSSQLATIDKTIAKWKDSLGEEKWSRLKVVIAVGHMPRERNSNYQYFCRLLGVKEEGEKIIVMEGLSDEASALGLLGTHVLDEGVAVAFFKDKWRMHRDLLSDGAARYLKVNPPLSTK